MATKLTDLEIDRVDFVDKGANPDAHITLFKRDVPMAEKPTPEVTEDVAKRMSELEKRAQEAEAKAKEATDQLGKSAERIATLETQSRDLVERSEATEFIAKAAEFKYIAKADEFAPILRKIHKTLNDQEREAFYKLLRGLNEAARQSVVFKELGVEGSDQPAGAYEKLEKLARERVAKAGNTETFEQAFAAVVKMPASAKLYSEYLKEGK